MRTKDTDSLTIMAGCLCLVNIATIFLPCSSDEYLSFKLVTV